MKEEPLTLVKLLRLGLIVGSVGGVAPPVIGVVTLDHIIILGLLHHLHLVNTLLPSLSNFTKVRSSSLSLTAHTAFKGRDFMVSMILMMSMVLMMSISSILLVEGECSSQRLSIPCVSSESPSTIGSSGQQEEKGNLATRSHV